MSSFDERAATWETNPAHAERSRVTADAIAARVPLRTTWSVVDVGSGTGLLSRALAGRVARIVLVDTSPGMTAVAAERIAASGMSTLSAACLDITAQTPPGAPFDLAVSLLMLHHVKDVEGFLSSIRSQLTPGGFIAFADLEAEDGSYHDDPEEEVHHHGFDPQLLAGVATSAGFVDVAVEKIYDVVKRRGDETRSYGLLLLTGRVPAGAATP